MTQTEHHYQRVDFEGGGFVEATRDDTDEIQELHYAVWKDGKQIHAGWVIYNIQYDYSRVREWWYGKPYGDYLESDETYGHLAEEYAHLPPEGGSPYPDDWEPVTLRGSDYFHQEGVFPVRPMILECNVWIITGFYIQKDITNPYKKNLELLDVSTLDDPDYRGYAQEKEEERKKWKRRDPHQEREERIQFLSELSRYIDERIPLDPRFID